MVKKGLARRVRRRWIPVLSTMVVVVVLGGPYCFQPWKLWTGNVVDEGLPSIAPALSAAAPASTASAASLTPTASTTSAQSTVSATGGAAQPPSTAPPKTAPSTGAPRSTVSTPSNAALLLADGELISHERPATRLVRLIRLANGSRVLARENLRTSNGPALHVWLTNSPVLRGSAGWHVFGDGLHLDLGELKGNIANQLYPLDYSVDHRKYSSVTIWCWRFSVSFGAAGLSQP